MQAQALPGFDGGRRSTEGRNGATAHSGEQDRIYREAAAFLSQRV
jgi:hypothetical protein